MRPATGLTIGYHGCDSAVGLAAIRDGVHPASSTNTYDWLGSGLYFWENDPARALHWATKHPRVEKPFVLGAVIVLGHCLDLVEVEHLRLLNEAYENLRARYETAGVPLPENKRGYSGDTDLVKRNLDCAVVNHLHIFHAEQGRPAFDTVRSPFSEGEPLFDGSGIMARTHIQICVRKPEESIIGYFQPLGKT